MTDAKTNYGELDPLFHPAAHCASPDEVLNDEDSVVVAALVDLCDVHYAPIPFSCRSATCGTCHVIIVQGEELFEPPNDAETLRILDLGVGSGALIRAPARNRGRASRRTRGRRSHPERRALCTWKGRSRSLILS